MSYEEVLYEGYGPGGVALMIDVLTDNRNRAVGEVRHVLSKHGGNLGESNSVSWMFSKRGYIVVEKSSVDEEALMSAVLNAGAEDLRDDDSHWEVITQPETFTAVLEAVQALGVSPTAAEISMLPQSYVKLEGKTAHQMLRLMEVLEDHEDVRHVWSNFDINEQEIEASLA